MDKLFQASPTAQAAQRAADIVAALAPPPEGTIGQEEKPKESSAGKVMAFVPGLIGAGVGFAAWGEHRVLGALVGHAVTSTAIPIIKGGQGRTRGLCQLGVELTGVAGSLMMQSRSPSRLNGVIGWGLGIAAGMAATAFVPGSPASEWWKSKGK